MEDKNFKEKLKSMTAKDLILLMVESLLEPLTDSVDMNYFGGYISNPTDSGGVKCFGCAATNTLLAICKSDLVKEDRCVEGRSYAARIIGVHETYLYEFEKAMDLLRQGDIIGYNLERTAEMPYIESILDLHVPPLNSNYGPSDLQFYVDLAEAQG